MPGGGEAAGHPQAQVEAVAARDDGEVAAVAVGPTGADGDVGVAPPLGRFVGRQPTGVARLVQVGRVVERDRFEEDADAAVDGGRGDAGPQHRRGVVGPGR